jgi:acid phosphatase class B
VRVGFDYWQVISQYPEQMAQIADAMHASGHQIYIVSAVGRKHAGTVAQEVAQLWPTFPVERVHEVVFEAPAQSPELKLAKCQELGIALFFDDRDDVCRLLSNNGILALRVTRKDNSTDDLQAERV